MVYVVAATVYRPTVYCIVSLLCCVQVSEAIQLGEDDEAQEERDLTEVQEQV